MTSVNMVFSASGQLSPVLLLQKGQSASYALSGTFSATVSLQKTTDGVNWADIATSTGGAITAALYNVSQETRLRWSCVSYTSGSPSAVISDMSDALMQVTSPQSGDVFSVTDEGIESSRLNIDHINSSSVSDIAATVASTSVAVLSSNEAVTSFASLLILHPVGASGNPSYYTSNAGEIQVPAVATNHLANATLYGGKFIVNYDTSATSGTTVAYLIGLESELILKGSNLSGTVTYANVYNLLVANEPFTQTGGGNVSITEYRGIYVEALSLGARFTITNQWNLYVEDTLGGSYFGSPLLVIGGASPAVGAVTHRGSGGIRTEAAATQDGVRLLGRAGGTSSLMNTITTAALTSTSKTTTLPNANMTFASVTDGGSVTQATSRTTGVTLNAICGDITLVSAAGSATWASFTVTNSSVAANDKVFISVKTGADIYIPVVTAIAAGSFRVSFADVSGTTVEQPVFTFEVRKFTAA